MFNMNWKDVVKDLSNEELLSKKVFDSKSDWKEVLTETTEKSINEKVEQSFQSFLDVVWNWDQKDLQKDFNEWLDKNVNRILNEEKIKEIKNINSDIESGLKSLEFELELGKLQQQIQESREENSTTAKLKDWITIEWIVKWQVDTQKLNTLIDKINVTDFTERDFVIDCLNSGTKEDIRKIQYLLISKKDQYEPWKSWNKELDLVWYWTDGLFWNETYAAIDKYIDSNKIGVVDIQSESSSSNSNINSNSGSSSTTVTETMPDGTIVTKTVDNTKSVNSNTTYEYGEIAPIWIDEYWKTNKFDCKIGTSIDITNKSFPAGSTLEIIPKFDWDPIVKFSKDNKLEYTSKFSGQDNFTVVVKDKDGKEIYQNSIIINIEWDVQKNNNKPQSIEKEIDRIVNEIDSETDYEKNRWIIEEKLKNLRKEYQDNNVNIDLWSNDNTKEVAYKELIEKNSDIEKITKVLILKEAESHLKEYLNKDSKTLETKLNEKCDYYIGGQYISKEKFLRKLDKNKIDLENIRFVNLDVDLTNYKWKGSDEIINYLNDKNWDKRNFEITDLIITDDPYLGIGKGLTKDQEIQYKSDIYVKNKEKISDISREKKALKRILWIKGLFGLGWVDEDMSIATEDYNTNNPSIMEKRNLRQLKNIIWDCMKDEDMTVQQKFRDVAKSYDLSIPPRPSQEADKNSKKLYEMYKMYKEDQNCGDYFKKVMGLFENYFIRWVDKFDVVTKNWKDDKDNLFTSMYKQEAIWRTDWLIDPDKKRKAINSVFKEWKDDEIKLWVAFADSKELKDLKRLVKNIDLSTYLDDPNASKKHEKFTILYNTYKNSRINDIKDGKDNFVVEWEKDTKNAEDLYYNAVFDFLVWMVEWRQDIVSAVNSTKIMGMLDSAKIEEKEENWYDNVEEKQFVMLLADFNKDGRVDHGDRWLVMWLTVKNMYKSVKVDQKYLEQVEEWESVTSPWQNLVDFAIWYMEQNWDVGLLSDLEKLKGKDLKEILKEIKTNPGLLNYLQNILANSPMPIDYIFRYGKNASAEYLNFVMPQIENGNFKIEWLDEKFKEEYKRLVEQWMVDDVEIRAILKPMFYAGVLQNGWVTYGAGGVWLALDAWKAGEFTLNLWYGDVPGMWPNGESEGVLGVVLSYGNSVGLSKNTDFNYGVWVWTTNKSLFVPMAYGSLWIKTRLNPNVNLDTLKAKSAHYFGVGANVNISLNPLWLIGWWVSVWWSRDKMELLDDQSVQIKESLTSKTGVLYKSLVDVDLTKDKENVISNISQNLAQHFYGKSLNDIKDKERSQIDASATNLYRGISYYTMWLKDIWWKLSADDPRLAQIIHDISEAYVINWKNDAKKDASGWHVTWVGVSVQLLANYIPIISVVEFTNYKNLYSKETNQSNANYYERLVTGRWMDFVENKNFYDEWGFINKNAVDYLNAKMSIAHPDVSVPDLDIKMMPKEDGSFVWDITPALYIPKNLISYTNINIDADVADYTTMTNIDGVDYIVVPSNTKIALMDYSRLNSARFHLFIWDNKAKENDIKVWFDMVDFGWSPDSYEWYAESIDVSKEKINIEVEKINGWVENADVWESKYFPIKECANVEKGKAAFELKEWFGKNCIDVWWNNSLISLEWDSLTMPQTGTLTILLKSDGKYYMYYRSTPSDKLSIDYQLEWSTTITNTVGNSTTITIENGQSINWKNTNINFVDVFQDYDSIDRIFDGIEKGLSKMDDARPWKYATFMDAASDVVNRSIIDNSSYDTAFDALKDILDKKIDDHTFDALRNKIYADNLSINEKVMVVDRFKSIFSYHIDLTNGTNNWNYFNKLLRWRGEIYKNLKWYDRNQKFPKLDTDYRSKISSKIWNIDKLEKIEKNNLFGMTAFYRLWNSHEWRSYSMTQMWSTNVLGGYMENILEWDLEATQNWFLNNLDKSGPHKNILKETLQKQIWITDLNLTDEQLKMLLMWKPIDINDGKTRINLGLEYVFYLLWECANESIGINLQNITIMEREDLENPREEENENPDDSTEEINENWRWKITVKWDKSYSSWVYKGSIWSNAEIDYARKNQVKIAVWAAIEKPKTPEPDDKPWSKPNSWGEAWDQPWSWPSEDLGGPWSGPWDQWDWNGPWWNEGP